MLLGKGHPTGDRPVAICTRNPVFNRLLAEILADWGFQPQVNPEAARVIFLERGLPVPVSDPGRLVWLTPLPLAEGTFLESPISLTRLYLLLEEQFFASPRRHIRVSLDLPADLRVEESWLEARMISLSDRGARLTCARTLDRQQPLCIEIKLAGRTLRLPGKALYAIPAGDARGRENPQVGVLFEPLETRLCQALRQFVEQTCLVRACERQQIALSDPATSWIQRIDDPWKGLA